MEYNVGDIVYVVSGGTNTSEYAVNYNYFVEARKVFKIGQYVTIGVDEKYTYNDRFVPTDNPLCDGYSLVEGQKKNKSSNYHKYHCSFGEKEYTHVVFKTRDAAEKFLYDVTGSMLYTYCNPFEYTPCKIYGEEMTGRLTHYGLN